MNFDIFKKNNDRAKELGKIKKLNARIFENLATTAITLIELERIRKILEDGGMIHGFQTIEHGIWHDDPLGHVIVNGRRGFYTYQTVIKNKHNLLTNGGRDFFHNQVYTNTSAGTRGAGFIALTTDVAAPDAADTTLATEITTGGLGRADADTKTHTTGTNVSTIEHTFTATAVHTAVVKSGMFNAATAGTMTHENTFTSVTLQVNDTLRVTWTLTLG